MGTRGRSSGRAHRADTAGSASEKRKRRARKMQSTIDPALRLAYATRPLLGLFAVVNDVFEEDDAFDSEHMRMGFARIYREWKKVREAFDPDWKRKREERRRS